tara:strand:- start:694 stop:3087 length:2394 start_codon:yes stop_codon:yes gene_type:complete
MPQASLLLSIDAEQKATKELNKTLREVDKLRKMLGKTEIQTKENAKANDKLKRSFKDLKKTTDNARRGMSKIKGAAIGLGAVFAGGIMINGIKEAAGFESKLASLGPNLEETKRKIKDLQMASGNMFSQAQIVQAQSQIKAFGLDLKLTPKLLETIAAKASNMGITTERAFDSFLLGYARMSPKILDNLGLLIKQEEATRRFKVEIGALDRKLTENEKALAFRAEVMRQINRDTSEVSTSFKNANEIGAKLDDAMMDLKASLVPLAPALVESVKLLAQAAVHLGNFTGFMMEALGLMDDAIDKRIKLTKAERITDVSIQRRFFLEKELQRLGLDSIEAFRKLEQSKQNEIKKTAKEREREILLIKNTQGHERATLALEKAGFTAREKNRILVQLGREINSRQVVLKIQKEQAEQAEKTALAAKEIAGWMSGVAKAGAMQMFAAPAKSKRKTTKRASGPTRAERAIDLDILDLQLDLQGEMSALDRVHIENLIKQLELDKLSVDRQRDAKGVLEAKQKILDASNAKRILDVEKKTAEDAKEKRNKEITKAIDQEKHDLAVRILDLQITLAKTSAEQARTAIETQIEDLKLQKAKVGATEKQIELAQKKAELEDAEGNAAEKLKQQADQVQRLSDALGVASSNMGSFSPGMAEMLAQAQMLTDTFGDNESTSEDMASASISAVGATAASFVGGEKEKAAIMGATEAAHAIKAIAFGDIKGSIAHGMASAMFFKAAGGASSGSAKKPAQASAGSGGGGGGGTVTVNFSSGVVLGNPTDIGKAVYQAQGSAASGGFVTGAI